MPVAVPSAGASLADWLAYQEQLHPRTIELGLERVVVVAARLGLPATRIPTLTVAGTNGKGSSATLASLIWREAGYRVGLYTSPHLLRYNERIALNGVEADDATLVRAFEAIERARGDIALTYFEFGTLAALWIFREQAVDVQVLEVGLGGRLDAVNLVDADAALLTSIGLDHTDWLGPDREHIGREKAHVYRAGRPAICADLDPPASIAAHAAVIGADFATLGRDFEFEAGEGSWTWRGGAIELRELPMPGLGGSAQLRNAAGVIAAVLALRPKLRCEPEHLRAALPQLALRGRFERQGDLVFDVAHNAEAAQVLAQRLQDTFGARKLALVLGMLDDKPVEAVCAALASQISGAYCANLPSPRGLSAEQLCARVQTVGIRASAHADVGAALQAAQQARTSQEAGVLVTGSFLTVAAGLTHGR